MVQQSEKATSDEMITFVMTLARALHGFGTPSHQLEAALLQVSGSLQIQAQFLATPTAIQATFDSRNSQTRMERCEPGETDLEKLTQLQTIIRQVINDELRPADATCEIEGIQKRKPRYSIAVTTVAFAITSGTAAIFFGGGWREMLVATAIGTVIGILAIRMGANPRATTIFPAIAALTATVISRSMSEALSPCVAFLCALSGLIVLVPGLTLTIAVNELANRHLVSGTSRLMGAMVLFFEIAFGVALGSRLCDVVFGAANVVEPIPVSALITWACLVPAAAAFTVLFRGRPKDYVAILAGSIVAFVSAKYGSKYLGSEVGPAVGAFVLGILSNSLARWLSQPAAITLVPGLLMLVPGSFGFKSLSALLANDVLSGIEIAFAMALTAVSLVTGLLLANLVVEPRKVLY